MSLQGLQPGDMVYAAQALYNDAEDGVPDLAPGALIAPAGRRGVLLNVGHVEQQPEDVVYLVRFEQDDQVLGPPIGCWPDELTSSPPVA